jgi:chromosome segregation ATPase
MATFLSERTKAEASMMRLLYESNKLETRLDELYRDIGKRVLELKEKQEKVVLKDFIILQTINEISQLKEQIEDYKRRAHDFSKPQTLTDKNP